MGGNILKEARLERSWTQKRAALALDVTLAYLSMLEKGHRPLSERLVSKALKALNLLPTALPLRMEEAAMSASWQKRDFSAELGALDCPRRIARFYLELTRSCVTSSLRARRLASLFSLLMLTARLRP
jgi:transcriptional regulator with XRE-family HTH domain